VSETVTRHEFLAELHRAYQPRSYLEIGINAGYSLTLSRAPTIAVDPAFKITSEIHCDIQVVRATSDDFFAREDALAHLPSRTVDLGFVDGLHWFEFALRDFMNVERHAQWTSVIVVDDVLPRSVVEASRERDTVAWTGDVFKITEVLQRYRTDLLLLPVDTRPTGVLLVLGVDPRCTALKDHYEEIVAEYVYADPQRVPETVLRRETAVDASSIIHSGVLASLRDARDSGVTREAGWPDLRRSVEAAARPAERRELTPETLQPKAARPSGARRPAKGGRPSLGRRGLRLVRTRLRPLRRRLQNPGGGRI
jgi:predicted O-methyltransferase YrrM